MNNYQGEIYISRKLLDSTGNYPIDGQILHFSLNRDVSKFFSFTDLFNRDNFELITSYS